MIFKKKKHPLPKFPESVADTFMKLCAVVDESEVPKMLAKLYDRMGELEEEARRNSNVYLELARGIGRELAFLLERYKDLDERGKKLVVGAYRYFCEDDDPVDDSAFASGLIDDAKVINHVLEETGFEERAIDIDDY